MGRFQTVLGRCPSLRQFCDYKKMTKCVPNIILLKDFACFLCLLQFTTTVSLQCSLLFSPENGVLLRSDIEDDYDRHMWIFDHNGSIDVLYQNWKHRNSIKLVTIGSDHPPSHELINLHNQMALDKAKHHCPNCWKYVGEVNIGAHQLSSCEKINL